MPGDDLAALRTRREEAAALAAVDLPRARDEVAAVFRELVVAVGPRHPDTLRAGVFAANWSLELGDPEAGTAIDHLLPAMTEVLGTDHPDTLLARHTALTAQERRGHDPAELVVRWIRLAADAHRVLGRQQSLSMLARFGVARARWAMGDRAGAIADGDAVCGDQRANVGDRHVETLNTRITVVSWRGNDGATTVAFDQLASLIPLIESVLGHDSPSALFARNARVTWTPTSVSAVDRVSESTVLVEDLTRVLGAGHALTQAAEGHLAGLRAEWRDWLVESLDLAIDLYTDMELDAGHGEVSADGRGWADTSGLDDDARQRVTEDAAAITAAAEALLESVTQAKRAASLAGRTFGNRGEAALSARYDVARAFMGGGAEGFADAARYSAWLEPDCTDALGEAHRLTQLVRSLRGLAAMRKDGHLPAYVVGSSGES